MCACVCVWIDWVDFIMLAVYVFYQVCFFVFPLRTILHHQLPTASAVVVVSEQVGDFIVVSLYLLTSFLIHV